MVATNPVTGDKLQSKIGNKAAYDDGYDRIFSKEARERLRTVEEKPPIAVHTIYKSIVEPPISVGSTRKGPCQLHDACVEKDCQCEP